MKYFILIALLLLNLALCQDEWSVCGVQCGSFTGQGGCNNIRVAVNDLDDEGCFISDQIDTEVTVQCPVLAPDDNAYAVTYDLIFVPDGSRDIQQFAAFAVVNDPDAVTPDPQFRIAGGGDEFGCPTRDAMGNCVITNNNCTTIRTSGISDVYPYRFDLTVCLNTECNSGNLLSASAAVVLAFLAFLTF